jgi:DNA-binding XRE family transcriptional regulator
MSNLDLDLIRSMGRIYREIVNLCPECMPKNHEQQAAQRPLIWLDRAVEKVSAHVPIPQALQERITMTALVTPTSAVQEVLYEQEQSAFLLGYHERAQRPGPVRSIPYMRQLRGMTQAQLADAAGVSRSTVCRLETADPAQKRVASTVTMKRIAEALKCSISDLL